MRGLIPKLRRAELSGTLQLLVAILIIWPLMPDRPLDLPGQFKDVLNLRTVVLFVVLTAGVGYVGYFMIRLLGPHRGLGVTGLVGGLTSSTAVTLAMGEHARAAPDLAGPTALATLLACGVMAVRVCGLAFAIYPPLGWALLVPTVAMASGYGLASGWLLLAGRRREKGGPAEPPRLTLENPFELGPALKFGLIYAAVMVLSRLAHGYLGARGLYLASGLAGLVDVDPITLAAARMGRDRIEPLTVGSTAVVIAIASNTLVKGSLAFGSGGRAYGLRVLVGHAVALLLGGAALVWLWVRAT
jgi:uncharacterized membrane protein (DUF4010 family)